jgi:Ricin-type beta-trefoil lectin domain
MIRRKLALGALAVVLGAVGATVAASPAQASLPTWNGHIYNVQSPRCLDSSTPTAVTMRTCVNAPYQKWAMFSTVSPAHISSNNASNCLDEGSGANGSVARMVTCVNNLHQKWIYNQTNFTLVNAASGRCLDADTGTINQEGTKVTVWDCSAWDNQIWFFDNGP